MWKKYQGLIAQTIGKVGARQRFIIQSKGRVKATSKSHYKYCRKDISKV